MDEAHALAKAGPQLAFLLLKNFLRNRETLQNARVNLSPEMYAHRRKMKKEQKEARRAERRPSRLWFFREVLD